MKEFEYIKEILSANEFKDDNIFNRSWLFMVNVAFHELKISVWDFELSRENIIENIKGQIERYINPYWKKNRNSKSDNIKVNPEDLWVDISKPMKKEIKTFHKWLSL